MRLEPAWRRQGRQQEEEQQTEARPRAERRAAHQVSHQRQVGVPARRLAHLAMEPSACRRERLGMLVRLAVKCPGQPSALDRD